MKYINPGIAELLDVDGGTTIESSVYNPLNGVALYQPTVNEGVVLSDKLLKIYGRFDVYIPAPGNNTEEKSAINVGCYNDSGFHGVRIIRGGSTYYNFYMIINGQSASSKTYYSNDSGINYDAINTVSFYIKGRSPSARDGEYTATFNGTRLFSVTGYNPWFNEEDECKQLVIHSTSNQMPLSNIILADAAFDLRERITAVPLGNPVTDMIDLGDGSYMAESAGQQILQSVDVSSLISAYGGASPVTGVAVAGNPAYRTAEGLTSFVSISKANGTQAEHGSKTLRTSASAGVLHCHTVDMTIADMVGMELGWKAGV